MMSEFPHCPVYVIDADHHDRRSVERVVTSAGYPATVYEGGSEFLEQVSELANGVLLIDLGMPAPAGLEVLDRLGQHHLRFASIVMTGNGDVDLAVQAMKAGARDFLPKPFDPALLLDKVAQAALLVSAAVECPPGAGSRLEALSTRERQVALALSRGRSNKQVAHELSISVRTVEMHRARAMQRLGCRSFAALLHAILQPGPRPFTRLSAA